jgi:hypothetical protein
VKEDEVIAEDRSKDERSRRINQKRNGIDEEY